MDPENMPNKLHKKRFKFNVPFPPRPRSLKWKLPLPRPDVREISGIGQPSVYHALIIIFLEFFAWGLLTAPMITVLNETFPNKTFLMNGLIQGIKATLVHLGENENNHEDVDPPLAANATGLLSFLSAPLIGALSDTWGRKTFLVITVLFTCAPIPLMRFSPWWFFAMISISGVFSVTFSIVFAYVADVTEPDDRSSAYGLVSGTFAASLVTSPAVGAYLSSVYNDNVVIALASSVALLDVFFIMAAVPESLPAYVRPNSFGSPMSWEQVDPFASLRKVGHDHTILLLCATVFLSYLPEAGQYSCFFVYLRLVIGFSPEMVASFIAVIGVLSVIAQTVILAFLMKSLGPKHTIMVGLTFEMLQLAWYGFGSQTWMMWAAGTLASIASITYPAISAFVSTQADADKQGVVQGIITGFRGLCNGLGPALFGFIFYLFDVNLSNMAEKVDEVDLTATHIIPPMPIHQRVLPGPPFVFGSILVILALFVAVFIPDSISHVIVMKPHHKRSSALNLSDTDSNPLLQEQET